MNMPKSILDLSWDDILLPKVLTKVTLRECFILRCVSKDFRALIELYFSKMGNLKIINKNIFPSNTFKVLSSTCFNLTVLNLASSTFLTDELLIPLLKNNERLIHVNLSHCNNITSCSIQPLILNCTNLRVLKLYRCAWLSIGAVEALTLHQTLLENVDFSYCSYLSDTCIILFLKKFRKLKVLSLEGLPQVGDRCMFAISKFSQLLKHLNVSYCYGITDKGIRAVANCKHLEALSIRGCQNVTEQSLAPLRYQVMLDRPPVKTATPLFLQV